MSATVFSHFSVGLWGIRCVYNQKKPKFHWHITSKNHHLSGIVLFIRQLMTHHYIWRILYLTHIVFLCNIYRICGDFLVDFCAKLLYMCSVFFMIFVQFLGVIKCLNNPFCAICHLADTKKPHIKNFKHPHSPPKIFGSGFESETFGLGAFDLFVTT